jgi:hypothetical protein
MTITAQSVQNIFIVSTAVGGALLYFRTRIPQQNVTQLTALTATYEKRITALEEEIKGYHKTSIENAKALADLQGQIKVYKELPLRELADGIKTVADSNDEILQTLKKSALVLDAEKGDGGLLVKTKSGKPLGVEIKEST